MSAIIGRRMLVATRIHSGNASKMANITDIVAFANSCKTFASHILLCISCGDSFEHSSYLQSVKSRLSAEGLDCVTSVLPITPWGRFTTALNAAILYAVTGKYEYIAFQSLEFRISDADVSSLFEVLTNKIENVLVVGPVLPGHHFTPGANVVLRGRTCPWNTFAIWVTSRLALTGFPMVGDGIDSSENGGVEEVTAINLLQLINPKLQCILVKTREIEWNVDFDDPERLAYHEKKMKSKDERPQTQLTLLNIPHGNVSHMCM